MTETMANYLTLFFGAVALFIAFYYYLTTKSNFWRERGVFGPKPHPIFGNLLNLTLARIGITEVVMDIYKKYKHEPVVGLFEGTSPILVLHDPDIIKNVFVRDFSSFQERSHTVHERTEPMTLNLFHLDAPRWRVLRPKITPIFTSKKLRDMFSLVVECSKNLEKSLSNLVATGEPVEIRELSAKFTTDVIGSCAFGIDMNVTSERVCEFRRMGKRIFETTTENILRLKTRLFWPELYNLLEFVVPERTLARFFTKTVIDMIKHRAEHNIYRPDFINLLMEFRKHPEQLKGVELTDESSTSMTWTLYELAQNHEIQDKVHAEIKAYHDKNGDNFTVDSLKELKYLDKVFKGKYTRCFV